MALYDYTGAVKLGRKQYQAALSKGEYPYLPVLDDILSYTDIVSEVSLGLMDIPLHKIVGTKTAGRTNAFANNFMPLLSERSEFGAKWANLYDCQIDEGIHDPIIAYEFMNQFYVVEGNKRVSVLKYLNAFSITGTVTRLIPKRTDDKDSRLYYEFLDFYQVSFNCDVWFSIEGSYSRLLEAMGKQPGEVWDEETRQYFKAVYERFSKAFDTEGGGKIELTCSDAFLIYVEIFGYEAVKERTESQIQKDLPKIWDELLLKSRGGKVTLVEQPEELGNPPKKLINWLLPFSSVEPEMLKIAFIHAKTSESSSWTYGHELGRIYLEEAFDHKITTLSFDQADTEERTSEAIQLAIASGCNLIFTTAPQMVNLSVKAAIQNPKVKIFNCSVNMSYSSICTYYGRMYESKFLMGAIAAAMAGSDKLGYIADYPIYGSLANINAFALGARMIHPYMKVYLEWSAVKDRNIQEMMERDGISYISDEDMITPQTASREYGLYHRRKDGTLENLATPILHWGKFYQRIVTNICRGAMGQKDAKGKQAINYWWGMSADVIDVICSQNMPHGTHRLITFLKNSIRSGTFQPFEGIIFSQEGIVQSNETDSMTPEEIVTMNWLAENVVGRIPEFDELTDEAKSLVKLQGVKIDENSELEE